MDYLAQAARRGVSTVTIRVVFYDFEMRKWAGNLKKNGIYYIGEKGVRM